MVKFEQGAKRVDFSDARVGDTFEAHGRGYTVEGLGGAVVGGEIVDVVTLGCVCVKCGERFAKDWAGGRLGKLLPARCADCIAKALGRLNLGALGVDDTFTDGGRVFRVDRVDPYTRRSDGAETEVLTLACPCPRCGTPMALTIGRFAHVTRLRRACAACVKKARQASAERARGVIAIMRASAAAVRVSAGPAVWSWEDVTDG